MELIWANKGGNSRVIVIPTANVNQDFTQRAIKNFQSYDYDILCVQDSGDGFSSTKLNWGVLIASAGIFFFIYMEVWLTEGNKGELNEGEK